MKTVKISTYAYGRLKLERIYDTSSYRYIGENNV